MSYKRKAVCVLHAAFYLHTFRREKTSLPVDAGDSFWYTNLDVIWRVVRVVDGAALEIF